MNTNVQAAKKYVETGLRLQTMFNTESISGSGSYMNNTEQVRQFLTNVIQKYNVRSILDLGCGDFNWMQHIVKKFNLEYTGYDANESLISTLNQKYGNNTTTFKYGDIFNIELPKVDMIICRDVLFHVDINIATPFVEKIKNQKCLFISTSFPGEKQNTNIAKYIEIDNWGFYHINLDISPFNIHDYLVDTIEEPRCGHGDQKRYVNLYNFNKEN